MSKKEETIPEKEEFTEEDLRLKAQLLWQDKVGRVGRELEGLLTKEKVRLVPTVHIRVDPVEGTRVVVTQELVPQEPQTQRG